MRVLLSILLLLPIIASSQEWWKHATLVASGIIAGVADGQREVIVHNKWDYRRHHPNANERWWNPDSTWKRANGNSWAGGSVFAWTKDKYHLNQAIRTVMFGYQSVMVVSLSLDEFKRKGKIKPGKVALYIAEGVVSYWVGKGATHWFYKR